jgi:hypothetical protein
MSLDLHKLARATPRVRVIEQVDTERRAIVRHYAGTLAGICCRDRRGVWLFTDRGDALAAARVIRASVRQRLGMDQGGGDADHG